jgi:predicted nucleic acid-binding protein
LIDAIAMTYVDTSALVALYTGEARGEPLLRWMSRRPHIGYCISDWAVTEFASALAVKARRGDIDEDQMAQAWHEFDDACDTLLKLERVEADDFVNATALCLQPATGLRSGDSLHLAIAARLACKSMLSFDDTLNRNAKAGGLAVISP